MIEAHPLHWPIGYKRTKMRKDSLFKQVPEKAQRFLNDELRRLGAEKVIVSSNIPVRKDGYMYADMTAEKITDPGISLYFKYKGQDVSMCCDQYLRPWENIYALGKGIEAIRSMERYGVSEFMERAFTGFKALPEAQEQQWFHILNLPPAANAIMIKEAYRKLAMLNHPDKGGTVEQFNKIKDAYLKGLEELTT